MQSLDLEINREPNECRLCLLSDPENDLIHPCQCIGTLRYTHRKCLDRWRTVSPHLNSLTHCEICKSKYGILRKNGESSSDLWRKLKYCLAVTLDISFFIVLFSGLWIAFGIAGDNLFNNLVDIETKCYNATYYSDNWWETEGCHLFDFTHQPTLWTGRVWFWGFICFFFVLGILGCCIACCCRETGETTYNHPDSHEYYNRGDCYWIWCGPTYYGGYYYRSPYGYWAYNDILCCWLCMDLHYHHSYHYHHAAGCNCGSCANCNGGGVSNCAKGNNVGGVLLLIVAIIVLIVVICGVIFATVVSFLVFNKILKRHLYLLEKRNKVEVETVVDLDDPAQVDQAAKQEVVPPMEKEPLLQ